LIREQPLTHEDRNKFHRDPQLIAIIAKNHLDLFCDYREICRHPNRETSLRIGQTAGRRTLEM
jgi:hypothetical protein